MHIIPEHLYSSLKGSDSKFLETELLENGNIRQAGLPRGKGEFEAGLLCADCDGGILNIRYENYAHKVLRDVLQCRFKGEVYEQDGTVEHLFFNNLDYNSLRLYLLSILWKASISRRPNYKNIKLGPYENEIRDILFSGNTISPHRFPVVLIKLRDKISLTDQIVRPFESTRLKKGHQYWFIANGWMVFYFISNHSVLPDWIFQKHAIGTNERVNVTYASEESTRNIFLKFLNIRLTQF
jgi:hypothetical protein